MRILLANPNTSQAVTDRIAAAVRQAETLASLRPRKPVAGSFRRPDAKAMTGLPAPLVRLFGGIG